VVVACMVWLDPIQNKLHKQRSRHLTYMSVDRPMMLAEIATILGKHGINITDVSIEEEEGSVQTVLEVTTPLNIDWDKVVREVSEVESVISVGLE
jgi:putative Mg2+ transporter-C (MgtC) family protein